MKINVIGAGLAGCEAAMQIASAGIPVRLYEMKPNKKSPAHKTNYFGELVCSNSLKAMRVESAAGLLKEEMRRLNSFLMQCADKCQVPAGGALAVDREKFAQLVTEGIQSQPLIEVVSEEITAIPESGITVIATGPLTSDALAKAIEERFGDSLSFFDAAAPIVTAESVNMEYAFTASRYERGGEDDYINCPMNKEEYERFYHALVSAERAPLHDFDVSNPKVYEGCMPVEVMAQRGEGTLRFGPMKPVGLIDPKTGHRPWAVLQLRKEMHRNTFLCSPKILNADFSVKENKNLFFAGQITGVEAYMESAASGILAGMNAVRVLRGQPTLVFPADTMMGALSRYIADPTVKKFQPMGANLGILPELEKRPRDKRERAAAYAYRALASQEIYIKEQLGMGE